MKPDRRQGVQRRGCRAPTVIDFFFLAFSLFSSSSFLSFSHEWRVRAAAMRGCLACTGGLAAVVSVVRRLCGRRALGAVRHRRRACSGRLPVVEIRQSASTGDSKSAMTGSIKNHKNGTRRMQGIRFCNSMSKMQEDSRDFLYLLLSRSPVERRADNVLRNPPATRTSPRGSRNSTKVETQDIGVRLSSHSSFYHPQAQVKHKCTI
jgi:hypothetical protein